MKRMLFILLVLFGCSENPITPNSTETLEIDARLSEDFNGYYHLTLTRRDNQTLHRISAQTGNFGQTYSMPKVSWGAYDLEGNPKIWVYEDQFGNKNEIPIINGVSYPDIDGIVNEMLAPVVSMVGDTVRVIVLYDSMITGDRYIDEVYIIFD